MGIVISFYLMMKKVDKSNEFRFVTSLGPCYQGLASITPL